MFDEIESNSKDKDTFVFAGNIRGVQSIQTIIEAAELLKDTKALFHIVGSGTDLKRLQMLAEQKSLSNARQSSVVYGCWKVDYRCNQRLNIVNVPVKFQKYDVRIDTDLDVKLHGVKVKILLMNL